VVDDASQDQTAAILDSIKDPRLRVVHLTQSPNDWIGKSYALAQGASRARGEYLIVTDGDVQFARGMLKRAVSYVALNKVDHLVLFPKMIVSSAGERLFIHSFFVALLHLHSPKRAQNPMSRDCLGIGAFNMIRRDAYLSMGGHEPIRMNINDDVALGLLVKLSGFSTRFLAAGDQVRVLWHRGVGRLIKGLEKNAFAGVGFSITRVLAGSISMLIISFMPYLALAGGLAAGNSILLWCGVCSLIAMLYQGGAYCKFAKINGLYSTYALAAPIGSLMMVVACYNSAIKTLWRGGVLWRGRFYPLENLKSERFPIRSRT